MPMAPRGGAPALPGQQKFSGAGYTDSMRYLYHSQRPGAPDGEY